MKRQYLDCNDYFGGDIKVVWKTATEDIPAICNRLNEIKTDHE